MKGLSLVCLTALTLSFAGFSAQASIQRGADFDDGSSLGVGLYGLSYDYGWEFLSLGLSTASSASSSLSNPLNTSLRINSRVLGRFYQEEGLSAAVLAGVTLDPGTPGGRAYLTPDLGLAIGYNFREFDLPFAVRLNLSLAISQPSKLSYVYDPYGHSEPLQQPSGHFLQRLTFGPQTSFEVAWMPNDNLELTLGGGTLLGMRLKF